MTKRKLTLRCLCEGAIMLALAQVLGYIKLWQLPNGGSVTLSMLPIFVFCIRWGFGPGLLVSFAFGLLQLFLDVAYSAGWQSIIGDYLLAFAVMGFAGLFKGKKNGIYWGSLLGTFLRFLVHYVTGATLWAEWMPDEFFGMTMTSPWIYSALYNGSFLLLSLGSYLLGNSGSSRSGNCLGLCRCLFGSLSRLFSGLCRLGSSLALSGLGSLYRFDNEVVLLYARLFPSFCSLRNACLRFLSRRCVCRRYSLYRSRALNVIRLRYAAAADKCVNAYHAYRKYRESACAKH